MQKLQKDLEEKKQENTELIKSVEKLKQRVVELETDCADLHEQVKIIIIIKRGLFFEVLREQFQTNDMRPNVKYSGDKWENGGKWPDGQSS